MASTQVTASQSVVDQCGLFSVDVVPMEAGTTHNVAAALISAVSGSTIRFTIHTRVVDPDKLQAAREQQQQLRQQQLKKQELAAGSDQKWNTRELSPLEQGVHVVTDHDFFDQDEMMITQNSLVTYTVKRSLEHFVWFQRQLSEKEPFLLFGELPTSLAAAYGDPLKTANQITAMIMFFVRSKATASDPFLWSLLTSPDDEFQLQYNSLVGIEDGQNSGAPHEGGISADIIAPTDFIASTQENISGLSAGSSSIAPMRWTFHIGNSWSVGSPFEGREDGGGSSDDHMNKSDVDEEESSDVKRIRRMERLLEVVDQDEYPAEVIKRTREAIAKAGLRPMKSATTLRFQREQRRKLRREKKTAQLLHNINERLPVPEEEIKPEQISKGMIESGMIDRAFFSCDKLNANIGSALHFQKELEKKDPLFYAWGDSLDALYRLKVALEDLSAAEDAVAPALRDLCDTNYWPWTKEKVFEEELKPKLSPRVHTSHRLTHYAHRIANIHNEVSRIEKSFVSDGLVSAVTLGAMLYSGHRWSCAIAHQRLHRGNKIDPSLRHAVQGLDQYYAMVTNPSLASGAALTNTYNVAEMKKVLLGVPPIFVQAVRTSLTPTAPTTGRSLLSLQKDLKTIFELGRGFSEADLLDRIDDDGSEIQDQLDTIIDTFQSHFNEIRHDALHASVAQYLKELVVFLKLSWVSAEMAIQDTYTGIREDLFMDLDKEELPFVMHYKTDPKAKHFIPQNFKVKEHESANTMIQQFRTALEKSRTTLGLTNGPGSNRNSLDIFQRGTNATEERGSMIRDHVAKQGGAPTSKPNKPFVAPVIASPFDISPPPPPKKNARHGLGTSTEGVEMQETSEEEWKQRAFLQQMAELQKKENQKMLQYEQEFKDYTASTTQSASSSTLLQPPNSNPSKPIPISRFESSPMVQPKASIFADMAPDGGINSVGTPIVGSSGGTKKRRFGKKSDSDDPFA